MTTVSERTPEIGVLKALGATDTTVARIVIVEAALIGAAGGLVGIAVGWVGAGAAAFAGKLATAVALAPGLDLRVAGLALVAATVVAGIAAWVPARRAARLVPADAIRSE